MIILPTVMTLWHLIELRDITRAYVEIDNSSICVVDYFIGIKKARRFPFSDITSAEIAMGFSHRVKGYRISHLGTRYIILRRYKKYLFKIIYLPEAAEVFKQFLCNE